MTDDWTQHADDWREEVAQTPPVVARSESGDVEIEVGVDLTVRRVALTPRATRDLDAFEETLRDVLNDALTRARDANPINDRVQAVFGAGQESLQSTLDDMQADLRRRTGEAEAYFAQLKSRMEAQRAAIARSRGRR